MAFSIRAPSGGLFDKTSDWQFFLLGSVGLYLFPTKIFSGSYKIINTLIADGAKGLHFILRLAAFLIFCVYSIPTGSASQSPSEEKPSSPFDISKIHKVFDDPNIYSNLSPVTSPSHTGEISRYSRHSSRRNSEEQESGGRSIRVSGDHGVKTHSSSSSLVVANRSDGSGADPATQSNPGHPGVNLGQGGGNMGQGGVNPGQGGVSEPGIALDQIIISSVNPSQTEVPSISVSDGSNGPTSGGVNGGRGGERVGEVARESTEEDRLLEFEGESESEPRTSSAVSLDQSTLAGPAQPVSTPAAPDESLTTEEDGSPVPANVSQVTVVEGDGEGGEGSAGKEEEEGGKVEGQRKVLEEEVGKGESGAGDETGSKMLEAGSKHQRRLPAVPTGSPEITTKVCPPLFVSTT